MTNDTDFAVEQDGSMDILRQAESSAESVDEPNNWSSVPTQEGPVESEEELVRSEVEPETRAYAPSPVSTYGSSKELEKNDEEVPNAARVIRILDAIRDLDRNDKDVALQFIAQKATDTEAESVVAVVHADPMLRKTLTALEESKDIDQVKRAFFIMRTEKRISQNMAGICQAFMPDEESRRITDSIDLAETLVRLVEDLTSEHMQYIAATQSIIVAAKGE